MGAESELGPDGIQEVGPSGPLKGEFVKTIFEVREEES